MATVRAWPTVGALTLLLLVLPSCTPPDRGDAMMRPAAGWRETSVDDVLTFAVPPDARAQDVVAIDSRVGVLRGDAYEIVYDYGAYGERLPDTGPGYSRRDRTVSGRSGVDISMFGDGNPWGMVRILQVADGGQTLTIRVSCVDRETCRFADDLYNSVTFRTR